MVSPSRAAGLALFGLGSLLRQTLAVDVTSCVDLITKVEAATGTASYTLTANIVCTEPITVTSGKDITVDGGGFTTTISGAFAPGDTSESLFDNQQGGTLTLSGMDIFQEEDSDLTKGVRAVYNLGALKVEGCVFSKLNLMTGDFLARGGVIYTASDNEKVIISDTEFKSSIATQRGGAICASGTDILTITGCTFKGNEATADSEDVGAGGDIYAGSDVTLTVQSSTFTDSAAEYGGAAIECCGASITDCTFTGTESFIDSEHYGALLVGRPDGDACSNELVLDNSTFTGCTVGYASGAGGSVAIFDTTAVITDCSFVSSQGTAVLFESSSANGAHSISMDSCLFNYNSKPSHEYAVSDSSQGTAIVVKNTGAEEGGEAVFMGALQDIYCYANDPYECEFVYHLADLTHGGEFKCQICNESGERQASGTDDDDNLASERGIDSGSSDSNDGIVIGLSLALGLTLVVIGALAVWKFRVRKNARRLMEDMGEGDL